MRARVTLAILALAALLPQAWAQEFDIGLLIDTLTSSTATAQEKDAACKRLKEIGTARAVPALAACLTDDTLSHPAREALQGISAPEAGQALLAALMRTSGANRAGIIDSLGVRREYKAVPTLSGLLADRDPIVAAAAARALGHIGAADVVEPLQRAMPGATGDVKAAVMEGLLCTAVQLRKDGDNKRSIDVAKALYTGAGISPHQRAAAYRAWLLALSPRKQAALILRGVKSDDPVVQQAALALAAEAPAKSLGKGLAKALSNAPAKTKIALLMALDHRDDPAAGRAVMKAAASSEPDVRLAALTALGNLGDAKSVPCLANVAAQGAEDEKKAARQALAQLRHGDVHAAILDLLDNTEPAVQIELAKALAVRRDREAIPALFAMAETPHEESVQIAALRALGLLGNEPDAARLIQLLISAKADAVRDAAEDAVVTIAGLTGKADGIIDALLQVSPAVIPVRLAALRAAARIDASRALDALRAAITSGQPEMREGAIRIMASYSGMDAIQDLLAAAATAADDAQNTIALRGYWRLVETTKASPAPERLALIRAGLEKARTLDDRKAALGALSNVYSKEALDFAEQARTDDAVRMEAETASYKIALGIFACERAAAEVTLRRLAAEATGERVRADAEEFKKALDERVSYVVPWLVSQPYRLEGKSATDLFDIPIGPELPDGGGVTWTPMSPPSDPKLFWQADLASVVGGNDCVVYLKTQVFWPRTEEVQLEMGSDDGIKVWVNGDQVHANNAVRGLTPEQDKAAATLKKGWNAFLVKISQSSAGCAMTMKLPAASNNADLPIKVEAR